MGRALSIAVLSRLWPSRLLISSELARDSEWLGRFGEQLAACALRRGGYKILYRNFRPPKGGEVDLVCRHRDVLVFVEVKTRTREDYGRPMDAVDNKKRNYIRRGAIQWLRMMDDANVPLRFDVVEIIVRDGRPELSIIENAFQPDIRL